MDFMIIKFRCEKQRGEKKSNHLHIQVISSYFIYFMLLASGVCQSLWLTRTHICYTVTYCCCFFFLFVKLNSWIKTWNRFTCRSIISISHTYGCRSIRCVYNYSFYRYATFQCVGFVFCSSIFIGRIMAWIWRCQTLNSRTDLHSIALHTHVQH